MNTLELATHGPVIPVIVIQKLEDAVPMAQALVDGGVKVLEITLRTPVALQCMEAIAARVPGAIVGAGTIRSVADAKAAKNAGCVFGVSPGYTAEIGAACRDAGLPLLPGLLHPDRWLLWLGLLFIASVYFFPTGVVGRLRNVGASKS